MMARALKIATALVLLIALGGVADHLHAQPGAQAQQKWVATWGTSQQIPEPQNAIPSEDLRDVTLRQVFHLSLGGPSLRVHLSNAFGTEALHIMSVHIAHPLSASSPAIDPATDKALTFSGSVDV